jgi:hypothetical protein
MCRSKVHQERPGATFRFWMSGEKFLEYITEHDLSHSFSGLCRG